MSVIVREKIKNSGIWWLFINHKGLRKSKKIGSSKAEANRIRIKLEAKLAAGDFRLNAKEPKEFSYYTEEWLKKSKVKDREGLISCHRRHIMTAPFYDRPVDLITRGDFIDFLQEKREHLARSTVVHIRSFLSRALQIAVDDEVIEMNKAKGISIEQGKKFKADPYGREDLETLLTTARTHYPDHYALLLFLARTGCRFGEAAGLRWDCLDIARRKAHICRTYSKRKLQETTKTGTERHIDLTRDLCRELAAHRLRGISTVFVFGGDRPIDIGNFRRRVWLPLIKVSGLRRTRIHDLRHSFASIMISETKDLYYTSRMLGHANIATTADRYGHLMQQDGENRPVDALDPDYTLSAPGKNKKKAGGS